MFQPAGTVKEAKEHAQAAHDSPDRADRVATPQLYQVGINVREASGPQSSSPRAQKSEPSGNLADLLPER